MWKSRASTMWMLELSSEKTMRSRELPSGENLTTRAASREPYVRVVLGSTKRGLLSRMPDHSGKSDP